MINVYKNINVVVFSLFGSFLICPTYYNFIIFKHILTGENSIEN